MLKGAIDANLKYDTLALLALMLVAMAIAAHDSAAHAGLMKLMETSLSKTKR